MTVVALASPSSETARLGKLAEYQILDTPPEKEFDEITQIAAKLIGAPISLVSLVDRDRHWFKARYGLNAIETPREYAFCAHAIKSDNVYVVDDATKNPLFSENPLVTGAPDIRFYAGAPLITPDNFRLGTLCVIDTQPHDGLSADAETILTLLARMVVNAMESRRLAMRAQHQARMMTQLAENIVALSQASTLADVGRMLADSARALAVADATCVHFSKGGDFVATRDGKKSPAPAEIPWQARGLFTAATAKDVTQNQGAAEKGSWMGFLIGLDKTKPIGHLQLWRQYTTTFTDLEKAMLTDLARVASAVAERLVRK